MDDDSTFVIDYMASEYIIVLVPSLTVGPSGISKSSLGVEPEIAMASNSHSR